MRHDVFAQHARQLFRHDLAITVVSRTSNSDGRMDSTFNFVDEIQAPANYNAGWINTHGVELSLLDRSGRVVRKYHTVLWDNDQVVKDLQQVLAEK